MTESTFTFRVDEELKSAFAEIAKAEDRTAAQLLRQLMRKAIQGQKEKRDYEDWFRSEVQQAIGEADDPLIDRIPHADVRSNWHQRREKLELQDTDNKS